MIQLLLARDQVLLTVIVVSVVSILTTLLTVFVIPDPNRPSDRPQCAVNPLAGAQIDSQTRRNLSWWLLNRFLFWAGLTAVQQFIIGYIVA